MNNTVFALIILMALGIAVLGETLSRSMHKERLSIAVWDLESKNE